MYAHNIEATNNKTTSMCTIVRSYKGRGTVPRLSTRDVLLKKATVAEATMAKKLTKKYILTTSLTKK